MVFLVILDEIFGVYKRVIRWRVLNFRRIQAGQYVAGVAPDTRLQKYGLLQNIKPQDRLGFLMMIMMRNPRKITITRM